MKNRIGFVLLALVLGVLSAAHSSGQTGDFPTILSMRERKAVVDRVTRARLDRLLPEVMRKTGFDMWVILCHEDNYDPVFLTMIPYDAWCPITQMLVFYDPGPEKAIERLNISRTNMEGFHQTIWKPPHTERYGGETQWDCLARIIKEKNPKKIGINESEEIWAAGGLTSSLKAKLIKVLGPETSSRLQSAEPMAILWLETLLDEEIDLMERAAAISHAIIAEAFSNRTITPGVTTTDDLVFYYRQRIANLGLEMAFRPSFSIRGRHPDVAGKYPKEDRVIRRGDLLHCDVGLKYLRYNSDHQELAYVLRRGETDVPEGLKKGLAEVNKLQDIFCAEFKEGLSGNKLLANILSKARAMGIAKPRVYSHSLGYYLHEPGPLIGLPWEQENTGARGEVTVVENSGFTVELSIDRPVPEWGGVEFRFPNEQDIVFTSKGTFYLDGRQTKYHLIK